ncbi:hypothetical protein M752DRAFT_225343, partial [Aspergillus phoenicis ATCC 13157]
IYISFDSISFYYSSSLKLQITMSASCWKLYKTLPALYNLSHSLSSKSSIFIANILISGKQLTAVQQSQSSTEDEASAAPVFYNTFDIKLERVEREYL